MNYTVGLNGSTRLDGSAAHPAGGGGLRIAQGPVDVPGLCGLKPDRVQREAARRIEASLDYMAQHFNEPLRISTLSALAGVSDSHFFSLFKCATGYSPMRFFIRLRMQRACDLLEETTLSLKEVAALLGYGDPFYFSRVFKSVNGVAPRTYRMSVGESRPAEENVHSMSQKESPERSPFAHHRTSKPFVRANPSPATALSTK